MAAAPFRFLQRLDIPSSGFRPIGPHDPLWKPGGSPQAAYARGRRAGPAFQGARAGPRPGPPPRHAARAGHRTPRAFPEGPQAGGRLCPGRAGASPARTSATVSPPRAKQRAAAGVSQEAQPATGLGAWAARLGGRGPAHSPSAGGRAAAGARFSWPQDTTATAAAAAAAPWGVGAKPPLPPPPSPRSASAAPQPPREHVPGGERAPNARAGRAAGA